MCPTRYFAHELSDRPHRIPTGTCLSGISQICAALMEQQSSGASVYVGGAGVAYALLRLATSNSVSFPLGRGSVVQYVDVWRKLLLEVRSAISEVRQKSDRHHGWSLLCGHAGVYATAAMVFDAASKEELPDESPAHLRAESCRVLEGFDNLSALAASFSPESVGYPEDEVLYGRAGYLLCLLGIRKLTPRMGGCTLGIVKALLDSGKVQSQRLQHPCPLHYAWPSGGRGRPYLGVAHGLMGILYTLLHFWEHLEALHETGTVVQCLRFVLSQESDSNGHRAASGYFPASLDSTRAPLVHWCHGSAGAVFLFCKAYDVVADSAYLQAAIRAGDVVWQRGLLKKGPGLCHGVSGNGYALLRLYRVTHEDMYLNRASHFAEFLLSSEFEAASTPDHPWSLYEGWSGALCFLIDIVQPSHSTFPFFEFG